MVNGMVGSCRLARAISAAGWGESRTMLASGWRPKGAWYGWRIAVADTLYRLSKTCPGVAS